VSWPPSGIEDYQTRFIRTNTRLGRPPLVPEVELFLATEEAQLWHLNAGQLEQLGLPAPFWAFAWAGGQALARFVLDEPHWVANKLVFSFAAGSGLEAIAAMKAGAASVIANDIDPYAVCAIRLNSAYSNVTVIPDQSNHLGASLDRYELILAGDICYEEPLASLVDDWLQKLADSGKTVLVGDPGRSYFRAENKELLATYRVETTTALEDSDVRNSHVWRVNPQQKATILLRLNCPKFYRIR
jgi:predicted nicotinamide N-methyase